MARPIRTHPSGTGTISRHICLFAVPGSQGICFQGRTSIHLLYGGYRYSEDLDFAGESITTPLHMVTCVSTNKTKTFFSTLGAIDYCHIKKELFFGYEFNDPIPLAWPEKSALDFVYIQRMHSIDPSLDEWNWEHLNYNKLTSLLESCPKTMRGCKLLQQHRVLCEILCVVNSYNVQYPTRVYRFFRELKAKYVSFLPLVEPQPDAEGSVSHRSVPPEAFGVFLCTIFDEWMAQDIGRVKIQIFEEAARIAFGQEHTMCIFRKTCGGVPVIEHNGDFYSCDHFVDTEHHLGNIREIPLVKLLESSTQRAFGQVKFDTLPCYCQSCEVRDMCNGGCPKNRFLQTTDGEAGLNYLCAGYKRFFTHCLPFIAEIANLWSRQTLEQQMPQARVSPKTGRNDPCPCGSGKKYKNCCIG